MSAVLMDQRKTLNSSLPADRSAGSSSGISFRIPKKKSPVESTCLRMESPLSRLKDASSSKISWTQFTVRARARKLPGFRQLNGSCSSSCRQMSNTKDGTDGLVLADVRKTEHGQDDLNRERKSLAVKIGTSGQKNDSPALRKIVESHTCSEPSTDTSQQRPFLRSSQSSASKGFRPKRASDTLCQDENLQRGHSSPRHRKCSIRLKDSSQLVRGRDLEWEEPWKRKVSPRNGVVKSPVSVDGNVFSSEGLEETERIGRAALSSQEKREAKISKDPAQSAGVLQQPPREQDEALAAKRICLEKSGATPISTGLKSGGQPYLRSEEKGLQSTPWHPPKLLAQRKNPRLRLQLSFSQFRQAKPKPAEPIVLSSDEEEVDKDNEGRTSVQAVHAEFAQEKQVEMQAAEERLVLRPGNKEPSGSVKHPDEEPSVVELPFSTLYTGKMKAKANGNIMVTEDCITIPLKDPEGDAEVSLALVPSEMRGYGMWGQGTPTVPLLFLWVSDALAQVIQRELSALCSVDLPGKASPFMLLKLTKDLDSLQEALLASLMDMMGLRSGRLGLRQPLSRDRAQALVQGSSWGSRLLLLLREEVFSSADPPDHKGQSGKEEHQAGLRKGRTRSSAVTLEDSGPSQRLILFPPPPLKGGIAVTTEDLQCLNSGEFLNDVIIDFYLKYLMLEKAPKEMVERSHIFSSFFYKQLTRKDVSGEEVSSVAAKHRRHQRVRTWTRHVDIFKKDYLFVPVNQEAHWYLVVICFPSLLNPLYEEWGNSATTGNSGAKKKTESPALEDRSQNSNSKTTSTYFKRAMGVMERTGDNSVCGQRELKSVPKCTQLGCQRETVSKRPCILIMDSLKLSLHEKIFTLLREYLQVEWEVRRGSPRNFTAEQMKGSLCRVPLQDNSSDCGVYLLQFAESFLQNPVVHFDLPLNLENWFPRQQVRRKRDEIRELVLQLYRKQKGVS
ncbi:sentrin-specific protease 7 isoform X2 [Scleropages formosus]|uniref:SUMO specific peptidase 7b n=2 Tax=Scleropages formosus TaxID=113540 RepID=A0A8C9QUG1_SCLFO|nr:sentrin-specific protease 7 isoform X2 [Scleropages formosus]